MSDKLEDFVKLLSEGLGEKSKPKEKDSLVERSLGHLAGATDRKTEDPLTPLGQNFISRKEFEDHYKLFISRVQQQMSTIGGGGEVNFLRLDDVMSSTAEANTHLTYNPSLGKVYFTDDLEDDDYTTSIENNQVSVINVPDAHLGPIQSMLFDSSLANTSHQTGTLCWNYDDDTLNITHSGGVMQQVGQELYGYVRNNTGSTIPNGSVVRFDGAESGVGESRLEISPMIADGTSINLYLIGVTTQAILDGEDGRVTVWGKVRDLNTSSWTVGGTLYVSPSVSGGLTEIKPTTPNNSIPVAIVLSSHLTEGEIFVRPVIEQETGYGTLSSTDDQTLATINTPTEITFNTETSAKFVSANNSIVEFSDSGLYSLSLNLQVVTTNSSKKDITIWLRKNGTDVPFTARTVTATGNDVFSTFEVTHTISMEGNDYLEFMWAASDVALLLKNIPATAYHPESPSTQLTIRQVAH